MLAVARVGLHLVVGEVASNKDSIFELNLKYKLGKPPSTLHGSLRIHERFIVKQVNNLNQISASFNECKVSESWEDLSQPYHGVDWVSVDREPSGMALESLRAVLGPLGVIQRDKPVIESFGILARPFHAYMKCNPFRDITKLHEGTVVEIIDYYKGCAVIEADGEPFWFPVESLSLIESKTKDDAYYFNMDFDRDNIPDPLVALPSKVALGQKPTSPSDNYQAQPELSKVAGNLYPLPDIDMDDVSILKDETELKEAAYTSIEYHHDYQHGHPEIHGVSGSISKKSKKLPKTEELVNLLIKGAPAGSLFMSNHDYNKFESAYVEAFKKRFPSLQPDLAYLRRVFTT